MDIDESVPLPEKLTTPLPELPKTVPNIDGDPLKGVELPKKLTTPLPDKLMPQLKKLPSFEEQREGAEHYRKMLEAQTKASAQVDAQLPDRDRDRQYVPLAYPSVRLEGAPIQHPKSDAGFDGGGAPSIPVSEDEKRLRIVPVTIQRPVEESARMAGGGFDLLKIKRDAESKVPNGFDTPTELPRKLRALGNREEKVFEPVGSSIPPFVAVDNTAIKLSEKSTGPKTGPLQVAKQCGVEFGPPKIGEPMMRRVKIVWPMPMEKAAATPVVPFAADTSTKSSGAPAGTKRSTTPPGASFPGQTLPTGAQPVQLRAPEERLGASGQAQIPMPPRPQPKFAGLQDPPRQSPPPPRLMPRELAPGEGRPSIDEILAAAQKKVDALVDNTAGIRNMDPAELMAELAEHAPDRIVADIAKRAQAILAREARAKDLEVENAALREIVKSLGGKVALYEVELQILKAKMK